MPTLSRPFLSSAAAVLGLALLLSPPAQAQTRAIDGADALSAVLAAGASGLTLDLAPGDYGTIALPRGGAPAVLRSADPRNPAVFRGLTGTDFSDLRLEGLHLDYRFQNGHDARTRPFEFRAFDGLTLSGTTITGDDARGLSADDNGFPTAVGLWVQDCSDVTVSGARITRFHRGLVVFRCENVTIQGNDVSQIRSDGMNFAQVERVRVLDNHIHSFLRSEASGDHADMIQIWTNGTDRPTRDVTIRGNLLNSGPGLYTQSIFMRNDQVDRGLAGREMFYRDITIEQNVILNAHLHGITIGETDGLTIRNNTVVQNIRSAGDDPGRPLWVPMIRVSEAARDVRIEANIVTSIEGHTGQSGWRVDDNLLLPPQAYGGVFTGMLGGDPTRPETFTYRPEGPAGQGRFGAASLRPR